MEKVAIPPDTTKTLSLKGMDEQFVQLLNRIAQNLKDRKVTADRMDSLMRDVGDYEEALEKLEQEGRDLAAQFDAAWELNKERMLR